MYTCVFRKCQGLPPAYLHTFIRINHFGGKWGLGSLDQRRAVTSPLLQSAGSVIGWREMIVKRRNNADLKFLVVSARGGSRK